MTELTREPFDALNQQAIYFMKQVERAWLFASEVYTKTGLAMTLSPQEQVNTVRLIFYQYVEGELENGAECDFDDPKHVFVTIYDVDSGPTVEEYIPRAEALKRVVKAARKAMKS